MLRETVRGNLLHFFCRRADFVGMAVAMEEGDGAAALFEDAAHFFAVVLEGFALGGHLGEEIFVGVNELGAVFVTDDLQIADDPAPVLVIPIYRQPEQFAPAVEVREEGKRPTNEGAEVAAAVGFGNRFGGVARIEHQTLQQD